MTTWPDLFWRIAARCGLLLLDLLFYLTRGVADVFELLADGIFDRLRSDLEWSRKGKLTCVPVARTKSLATTSSAVNPPSADPVTTPASV